MSSAAHAAQMARLAPATPADDPVPERGHRRGTYIDRSRTDAIELRGIGICGKGITGCMPHHKPGDSVAYLERMLKDEANLTRPAHSDEVRARLKVARGRFKRPHTT